MKTWRQYHDTTVLHVYVIFFAHTQEHDIRNSLSVEGQVQLNRFQVSYFL